MDKPLAATESELQQILTDVAFTRNFGSGYILCRAKILKPGKRLIYGTAECVNGQGDLLTHHTITYTRRGAA
jgi:acyl-coenzyme A thioesterase PaaI-like protein